MEKDQEQWKHVIGFHKYVVSDLGRIRNTETGNLLKLSPGPGQSKSGKAANPRINVTFTNSRSDYQTTKVHLLVMKYFGPAKPKIPGITVDHRNRNSADNRMVNLRWATKKEQQANRTIIRKATKLSMDDLDKIYHRTFNETFSEIAVDTGIDRSTINKLLLYMHPLY